MIDVNKIKPLPSQYANHPNMDADKLVFEKIKIHVAKNGLDDMAWGLIANNTDKIQSLGVALIALGGKFPGYKKYIIQAFGYGIKYAGVYIDKKIVTYNELTESRKKKGI